MATITLTAAATSAVQFVSALDSGVGLSTQQVADALGVANILLANWTNEQTLAFQTLIKEQYYGGQEFADSQASILAAMVAKQAKDGAAMVDRLNSAGFSLAVAYTLAGGTYTAGAYTAPTSTAPAFSTPTFTPGTVPQFADATTPLTLPNGVGRALVLGLALELAPQYGVSPSADLVAQAEKARAAAFPVPGKVPVPQTAGTQEVQG